jgi:hypothetical protein
VVVGKRRESDVEITFNREGKGVERREVKGERRGMRREGGSRMRV